MKRPREPSSRMAELVIFDCDGVLVDSERIGTAMPAKAAISEGAAIGVDEALRLFRGPEMAECVVEIQHRSGRRLGESFIADVRQITAAAFASELRAIEGIHAALAAITIPRSVAPNGRIAEMAHTLALTGLLDYFQGRIFSAYDVGV
jgi:beta-phosphoglucomutase-like phosphatase (HAD superfamily)